MMESTKTAAPLLMMRSAPSLPPAPRTVQPHVLAARHRLVRGSWSGAASCLHAHFMFQVPCPGMYSYRAQEQPAAYA